MTDEYQFFLQKISSWLHADFDDMVFSHPVPTYDDPAHDPQKLVFIESGVPSIAIGRGGKVESLSLPAGTVIYGACGAPTGLLASDGPTAQTLAVSFFPDYIRLVEYQFGPGASLRNVRFLHTAFSLQFGGKNLLELLDYARLNPIMANTAQHLAKALLSLLSALLQNSDAEQQRGKSAFTWRQIESYIKNHLSADLSRRKLAAISKLNPNYLSTLCREKTGLTLNEYIRQQRLTRAAILLEQDLTLDEISSSCGFQYTSYFIRLFKEKYGSSPGKYRYQHSREKKLPVLG